MDTNIPQETPQFKQCHGPCQQLLPAASEYFSKNKNYKDGLQNFCKKCANEYHKKFRREGPIRKKISLPPGYKQCQGCERVLPATPEYFHLKKNGAYGLRSECKVCRNTQAALDYKDNPEYAKEYYRNHIEVKRQSDRQYRIKNANHIQEYNRSYRETHRVERRAHQHNREARKRSVSGSHTAHDIKRQYDAQRGKCYYCKDKVKWEQHHIDHVVPVSRGGSNDPSNLVVSCPTCNLRKHDKLPHEWLEGGRLC